MTGINNREEYAEDLFNEALKICLDIRKQRKVKYGNCWFQDNGVEANYWGGVVNKFNRLKVLHSKRLEDKNYESYEDTLKDMVILTLFTLACHIHEKYELEEKNGKSNRTK